MAANLLAPKRHRTAASVIVTLTIVLLAVVSVNASSAPSASAASIVRQVVNAAGGIYWRSAPDWNTPIPIPQHGVYNGDQIELECYVRGGTVPPYFNNPLWYRAKVVVGYGIGEGLVNDHFVDTGNNQPNVVVSGVPACSSVTTASAPIPHTNINGVDVGYPQNQPHFWGNCNVQDFKGGPYDWVIVSYTYGTHIVRNGMLWGWFDQGGAPGSLGCPLNDEHDAGVGVTGVVRQDFLGGSLLWAPGMDHAVKIDFRHWGAIRWALACMTPGKCVYSSGNVIAVDYAHYCLAFVYNAYHYGQQVALHGGPTGDSAAAYQWWYGDNDSSTHPNDTNAPFGSFVVWNKLESSDGSGHIALGLGRGYMLTTLYDNSTLVHIERIAPHNDPNYFGWEWPK